MNFLVETSLYCNPVKDKNNNTHYEVKDFADIFTVKDTKELFSELSEVFENAKIKSIKITKKV